MREFEEWSKGRSRLDCGGLFKSITQCELEAFKAGMLAAADIAWTSEGIPSHGYDEGREDAADEIREAAK